MLNFMSYEQMADILMMITYFSHNFEKEIQLENYLLLEKLNTESIAYLHSDKEQIKNKSICAGPITV